MEFKQEFNGVLVQEKNTVIDKNYLPQVGDILSNSDHPLVIIEHIYYLNRTSTRINKNYNDHLAKSILYQKIIDRKEIIWSQHRLDFKLFPETNTGNVTRDNRQNIDYSLYCFHNDKKQYHRLYYSKYRYAPERKFRVITGKKTMVTVSHGLCRIPNLKENGSISSYRSCCYYHGKKATPVTLLISKKFVYKGNIYFDILTPLDIVEQNEN